MELFGAILGVKRVETATNGDTVVAIVNNEATLKRFYKKKKTVELHPRNKAFDIIKINKNDNFQINGIVLAVLRKYNN